MSSGIIDQITLECLMNKDTYNKIMLNKTLINEKNKDKKFYRKRISNLTKELLLNEPPNNLLPDVSFAFDNYIKTCIHYFKIIDESEIIQRDYDVLKEQENAKKKAKEEAAQIESLETIEENKEEKPETKKGKEEQIKMNKETDKGPDNGIDKVDNLILRSVRLMTPTLDNFISLSSLNNLNTLSNQEIIPTIKKEHILPKKKDIDLMNPELKNKGICKKKNIIN